jgi:hypothetical protein
VPGGVGSWLRDLTRRWAKYPPKESRRGRPRRNASGRRERVPERRGTSEESQVKPRRRVPSACRGTRRKDGDGYKQRERKRKAKAAQTRAQAVGRRDGQAGANWWLTLITHDTCCANCAHVLRVGKEMVYRYEPREALCVHCAQSAHVQLVALSTERVRKPLSPLGAAAEAVAQLYRSGQVSLEQLTRLAGTRAVLVARSPGLLHDDDISMSTTTGQAQEALPPAPRRGGHLFGPASARLKPVASALGSYPPWLPGWPS